MKILTIYIGICITLLLCNKTYALPDGPLPDAIFDENFRTIEFFKEGWAFSYPILELGEATSLVLNFDVLEAQSKNYTYSVVLCDADWVPSRLSYTEYMDGFFQNAIYQYQSSMSTNIPYQHYQIKIPNENITLKLSGNYAIVLYEDSNDDKPLLIKRFTVVDPKVTVNATAHRAVLTNFQDCYQEVDFTILHSDYPIENPYQNLRAVVVKNNQWRNSLTDLKPLFIRDGELIYDYQDKNLFPGVNEYRSFDTKSLKYQQSNISSINYVNNRIEVDLHTDKSRSRLPYLTQDDLNGKFLVQNQQGVEASVDAEYVWMKFHLYSFEEITDGDVFIVGGFTDNNLYDDNKMVYNADKELYELNIPVKQGYFNYQYVFRDKAGEVDETRFEGCFYETENDYVIYIYYRPFGQRYDSLIGVKIINTIKYN